MPDPITPPPSATPPAGTPPPAPWFAGKPEVSPELIGHIQTRGWADKDPVAAAIAAASSHLEAQKHIGVPAERLIRLPQDKSDEAGWRNVWNRLGAGTDPKDYVFKTADGKDYEPSVAEFFAKTAFKLNMPKEAAAELVKEVTGFQQKQTSEQKIQFEGKLAEEKAALKTNWGKNFEANMFVARNAAEKLGLTPEIVNGLEQVAGYSKVMDFLRNVGQRIGEAKFIAGDNPQGNGGVMTQEQAIARKSELMKDSTWTRKYLEGDAAAAREMMALNVLITGTQL